MTLKGKGAAYKYMFCFFAYTIIGLLLKNKTLPQYRKIFTFNTTLIFLIKLNQNITANKTRIY